MGRLQRSIAFWLLALSFSANADFGLLVGTGGLQGKVSGGVVYGFAENHSLMLSAGQYSLNGGHGTQLNFGYRYLPWHLEYGDFGWSPVGVGLVSLYALDRDDYFTKSPSKYPSEGYYEQTGLRFGLEFSSEGYALNRSVRLLYKFILLDSAIVALVNNDGKYAQYFYSAGLELQYRF